MSGPSRRTVAKGAAWSVPAVALAAAAPAFAASAAGGCSAASVTAINNAFTSSTVSTMEANFYQAALSSNGLVGVSYVNFKNIGTSTLVFTAAKPLTFQVDVHGLTGPAQERTFFEATSFGSIVRSSYDATTRITRMVWTFVGTVAPGDEPDMAINWGDGFTFSGRITNDVVVTPLASNPPAAPPLSSIITDSAQAAACQSYYDSKLAAYNPSNTAFAYRGPAGSGSLAIGESVTSSVVKDYWSGTNTGDGIY